LVVREELARAHHDADFHVPHPTVNLGRIVGGDNPNRICPSCELHFDCRVLPGMNLAATREAIRARLAAAVRGTGAALACEALFDGVEALTEVPGSALVALAESLTAERAHAVAFSTEAPFLRQLGIETVVLGPGDIATAHQPDEWLAGATIEPYVGVLERFIQRCCVEPAALAS
jgi:acetylornithine deacetylase